MSISEVTASSIENAAPELMMPPPEQTAKLIAKAEVLVIDYVPNVTSRLSDGRLRQETLNSVIEDMVIRVLRNPQALRTVSVDDGSATLDGAISSGLLYLSDVELDRLRGHAQGVKPKVRSIKLRTPWRRHAW